MKRGVHLVGGLGLVLAAGASAFAWSSCGGDDFNVFQPVAAPVALKTDVKAQLEEARVDLDKKRYGQALSLLQPIIDDPSKDSNDARVLYASAKLGNAGFGIWDIISGLLTTMDNASSGTGTSASQNSGLDDLLNSISDSVLGTGADRTAHVQALYDTVDSLQHAPNPSDPNILNVSCIVAAFLAVPTISDANTAMTEMTAALTQISASAQSGGTVCPDIGALDTASAGLSTAAASFNYILQIAKSCTFMNLSKAASQMNNVETALATLMKNADKGCSTVPKCPAAVPNCKSLFPSCVQQVLAVGTSGAVAGDGVLAPCEIILNCTDPTQCFPTL